MNLFSSGAGMVVELPASSPMMSVYVDDGGQPLGRTTRRAIITSINGQEVSQFQVRAMFNRNLYILTFGDEPGKLSVGGLFLKGDCSDSFWNDRFGTPPITGFEQMYYYYRNNRISYRAGPVVIIIGGWFIPMIYEAFLTSFVIGVNDPAPGIGQFSLDFFYPVVDYYGFEFDAGAARGFFETDTSVTDTRETAANPNLLLL